MRKIAFSFVITFNAFADGIIHGGFADDGEIHTGGKSCPQNQTCLVNTEPTKSDSNNPILLAVRNFLNLIF